MNSYKFQCNIMCIQVRKSGDWVNSFRTLNIPVNNTYWSYPPPPSGVGHSTYRWSDDF